MSPRPGASVVFDIVHWTKEGQRAGPVRRALGVGPILSGVSGGGGVGPRVSRETLRRVMIGRGRVQIVRPTIGMRRSWAMMIQLAETATTSTHSAFSAAGMLTVSRAYWVQVMKT